MADILLNSENQRDRTWRRLQPFSYLAAALAAESERRVLWLPVWWRPLHNTALLRADGRAADLARPRHLASGDRRRVVVAAKPALARRSDIAGVHRRRLRPHDRDDPRAQRANARPTTGTGGAHRQRRRD